MTNNNQVMPHLRANKGGRELAIGAGSRKPKGLASLGLGLIVPLAAAVIWEATVALGVLDPILVSSPTRVIKAGIERIADGSIFVSTLHTLTSIVVAIVISVILGLIIGGLMGLLPVVDDTVNPLVILAYNAPLVAFYPLIIIIFGLTLKAIIFLAVLFAIIPVIINTVLAVNLVPPTLIRTARSFGGTWWERVRFVVIPGSVTVTFTGIRLAVGRAVVGVIVAEMFMGDAGLGYELVAASGVLNMSVVYVCIVAIGILGSALVFLAKFVEGKVMARFEA